jgi:hypothetical protein
MIVPVIESDQQAQDAATGVADVVSRTHRHVTDVTRHELFGSRRRSRPEPSLRRHRVIFGFRPGTRPWARASASPARVRSRIISRSNSAKEPSICISMQPAGPDVSTDSVSDRNFAPAALTRSRIVRILQDSREPRACRLPKVARRHRGIGFSLFDRHFWATPVRRTLDQPIRWETPARSNTHGSRPCVASLRAMPERFLSTLTWSRRTGTVNPRDRDLSRPDPFAKFGEGARRRQKSWRAALP